MKEGFTFIFTFKKIAFKCFGGGGGRKEPTAFLENLPGTESDR